jgi:MOSC domain-containing protein YiiM
MWRGSITALYITSAEGKPMVSITEAHAVAGKGLEGDRYFLGTGHFSSHHSPSHEVTLIEGETIDALNEEYPDLHLQLGDARRNLVTRGVPLNHLVGHVFHVGAVKLRGIRLCQPCLHIAQLTHHNVLSGLIHRGGLRAQILTDGIIHIADPVIDLYEEQIPDHLMDEDAEEAGMLKFFTTQDTKESVLREHA